MNNIIDMQEYLVSQNIKEFRKLLSLVVFVNLMAEIGYSKKDALKLWKESQDARQSKKKST